MGATQVAMTLHDAVIAIPRLPGVPLTEGRRAFCMVADWQPSLIKQP